MSEVIIELLKYIAPAGLVLGAVWMLLNERFKKEEMKEKYDILKKNYAHIMPLRLQAYERAVLFLERISPENLVMRCDARGKTARVFQAQMIMEIKSEYEHNLAQQIYMSNESWKALVKAKDQMIAMINILAAKLPENASGVDLGKRMLNEVVETEMHPPGEAIRTLKGDIQKMFRS